MRIETNQSDVSLTDPEPDMHRRQASVRNVRSKCRCSCVLQFTFRRAVSCVLHRPPSQVIHCIVLSFKSHFRHSIKCHTLKLKIFQTQNDSPSLGSKIKPETEANTLSAGLNTPHVNRARHLQNTGHSIRHNRP